MFKMMFKTILLCLCMTACNDNDSEYSVIPAELINKIVAVPAEYGQEAEYRT